MFNKQYQHWMTLTQNVLSKHWHYLDNIIPGVANVIERRREWWE